MWTTNFRPSESTGMSDSYLLHTCVATRQLLPEVGDVMVILFQVLLEVVAPERQQGFFYLGVKL